MMDFNHVFPFVFYIFLVSFGFSVDGRLFYNYFEEPQVPLVRLLSQISLAPSPAPEASLAPPPPPVIEASLAPPPPVIEASRAPPPSPAPEASLAPPPPVIEASLAPPPPPVIEASRAPPPSPAHEASLAPPPPVIEGFTSSSSSPVIDQASLAPPPPPVMDQASLAPPPPPMIEASLVPPPPVIEALPPSPADSSSDSAPVFNVLSYGAVGDGVTDDTQAFKMAWDDACHADFGILLVPSHYTFMIQSAIFTGPCKSELVFQIEGILMPPDGPDSWPKYYSKRQWLVFYRINGMSMQGSGLIDGRGEKWWDLPCKPHKGVNGTTLPGPCDSPVAIRFFVSSNLTVKELRVRNSPQFHFRFDSCRDVHIRSLYIKSPSLSPNTDGIHLENTTDVKIHDSIVYNGDDCISIGAGCHNVDIRNITCGPSHGISIGSLGSRNSRACVSNITVTDSVIKHSDNGVRIKTWQGGFGSVSKVTFDNIRMDTVRNPIIIDQYYCDTKGCKNQSSAVYISDIYYANIKGTYDVRSPPMRLACSDAVPCTNLTFSEVELFPAQGQKFLDAYCWKAYGALNTLTIPPVFCLLGGFPDSLPPNDGLNQC